MSDLVKSISIENMLNHRNVTIEKVEAARALLLEAKQVIHSQNGIDLGYILASRHDYGHNQIMQQDSERNSYMRDFTQRLDAQLWQYLMHESGLRTFMDQTARKEWDNAIRDLKTPALTIENIEATFEQLHGARGDMFERGVIEVFKRLSWNYKSNLPQKFGKRIIIENFMDSWGHSCNYSRGDKLADMERVMHILDGKPAPDHRQGIVQLCGDTYRSTKIREASDDYLRVKWFKNHNGHFHFKRLDLIDKMNKIIAKHYPGALPAAI